MGCATSTEERQVKTTHAAIEKQLATAKLNAEYEMKILLLGAGESGKSTILKQMTMIYGQGFTHNERIMYRILLHNNTITAFRALLDGMAKLGIALADPQRNAQWMATITELREVLAVKELSPDMVAAIKSLWADPGVQLAYARSNEFQLMDSAKYYFSEIDRITRSDYLPTDADILRVRVKTTGIAETKFQAGDFTYRVFDVGGQRSERKKWIHCFENVTSILFLVAVSEYDQKLFEDESTNRIQEALTLFESICNSRWFVKTSMILFLNKIDLFKEKLVTSPPERYFPNYPVGLRDYPKAIRWFRAAFEALNQNPEKKIFCHFTCATDTQQIRFVMAAVQDTIIQANLALAGLT
ncbi:guanine nucleotide-binding protein subunit alpha [Sorochytrium milnesiophthora]